MNTVQQVIIISADRIERTEDQNALAREVMVKQLRRQGIEFASAEGVYKGTSEHSFVCALNDASDVDFFQYLRAEFNQECFMYIDSNGMASLEYEADTVMLGKLKQITKEQAMKLDAYTRLDETYFAVV